MGIDEKLSPNYPINAWADESGFCLRYHSYDIVFQDTE